jgi:hypothetical protein
MSDVELSRFINKVGEIINTKTLLANLKKQFLQEGYIKNKYGRRLDVTRPQDNIFINYYAQSTGIAIHVGEYRIGISGRKYVFTGLLSAE